MNCTTVRPLDLPLASAVSNLTAKHFWNRYHDFVHIDKTGGLTVKITKFIHSCLLIEMPMPVNRTVLFDPGMFSTAALDITKLQYLDDIVITHNHPDHFSIDIIKQLVGKFPEVRITSTAEVVSELASNRIAATDRPSDGIVFFDSPHEDVSPGMAQPQEIGVHYLGLLTNPGDSFSFTDTKAVLALPVQAPWGSSLDALRLALKLKPRYVIPIHDWHWSEQARVQMYDVFAKELAKDGITLLRPETAEPVVIEL